MSLKEVLQLKEVQELLESDEIKSLIFDCENQALINFWKKLLELSKDEPIKSVEEENNENEESLIFPIVVEEDLGDGDVIEAD